MKFALVIGSIMCFLLASVAGPGARGMTLAQPVPNPHQIQALATRPAGPVVLAGWLFGKQRCKVGDSCCAHWWDVQCW
jgi:hypothetical protein